MLPLFFFDFFHQYCLQFKGGKTRWVIKLHTGWHFIHFAAAWWKPDISEQTKRICSCEIKPLMCKPLLYLVFLTPTPWYIFTLPTQTTQLASGPSGQALTAMSRMCTSCLSWWLTAGLPPSAPQAPWPFMSVAVTQVRATVGAAPLLTLSSLSPSASAARL